MSKQALAVVANESRAKGSALLVAYALADHTNRHGWAWPSVAALAGETGVSERTVLRALDWLEQAGELHIERSRSRRGNRYRLRLPGVPGGAPDEAPDATGTVTPVHRSGSRNGDTSAPLPGPRTVTSRPRNGDTSEGVPAQNGDMVSRGTSNTSKNLAGARARPPARARGGARASVCTGCGGSGWVPVSDDRDAEVVRCGCQP